MRARVTTGVLGAAVAAAVLTACGTVSVAQHVTDYLDPETGATISRVEKPFILFSEEPARAANARDLIYAAPLTVNQSGSRSSWLWLGLWSTIDRGASAGEAGLPDIAAIQLIVDGEPMELDLSARADRIPGVTRLPYAAPVSTATNIVLQLTSSQVARLSHGASIVIRTEMANSTSVVWQPWGSGARWLGFAELAAADPGLAR